MKVSFSFAVQPEHRLELLKLGGYVPENVVVEIEPSLIPEALRADVMSQLKFDQSGVLRQPRRQAHEMPSHPAHNLRALYLTLSREAQCQRRLKAPARVAVLVGGPTPAPRYALPAQRQHLSNAAHLIQVGPLQGRFSHAELCGLAEAHSRPFAPCVDVDKRHLLLLQCENAPALAVENGYEQGVLLDKLTALTMSEGEALFNTLKRYRCNREGFAANTHDLRGLMTELGR
jgi:hypothetical protein